MPEIKNSFYKEHPKTCRTDDFWGQVKRTVNGKPVSQEQINMIVETVLTELNIQSNDYLLDLCCGNGALTTQVANNCFKTTGVDFSESLIDVAKTYFENKHNSIFILEDIVEFSRNNNSYEYTKALCYGSFQYLSLNDGMSLLKNIRTHFPNINNFFIGNLPDRDKVNVFYTNRSEMELLTDPRTDIGVWRTKDEFRKLADQTGWDIHINTMPENFYSSNYRYDVILSPKIIL